MADDTDLGVTPVVRGEDDVTDTCAQIALLQGVGR